MAIDVVLEISYRVEDNKFKIEGDAKRETHAELISEFLRWQVGAGIDHNPRTELPIYKIKIGYDLMETRFYVESDTGNKGLRDGILLDICSKLDSRENWEFS